MDETWESVEELVRVTQEKLKLKGGGECDSGGSWTQLQSCCNEDARDDVPVVINILPYQRKAPHERIKFNKVLWLF